MIAMAIIHFMYINEKRVVSIVRAGNENPWKDSRSTPCMPGGMGKDRKTSAPFLFIITANHQNAQIERSFPIPPAR